jgi:DNA replication protein DnaC
MERSRNIGRCSIHGEFDMYQTNPIGFNTGSECPECWKSNRAKLMLERSNIPPRHENASIENFDATSIEQIKVKTIFSKYLESVLSGGTGNMLMIGGVGTGKTHLACAAASAFCNSYRTARYVTAREAIRAVRDTWRRESTRTEQEVIDSITDYDLLIFDEVGIQAGTDNERDIVFDIIDGRYKYKKPTIFVSNLDISGIKNAIGERALDRLRQDGTIATFTWKSYRQQ